MFLLPNRAIALIPKHENRARVPQVSGRATLDSLSRTIRVGDNVDRATVRTKREIAVTVLRAKEFYRLARKCCAILVQREL